MKKLTLISIGFFLSGLTFLTSCMESDSFSITETPTISYAATNLDNTELELVSSNIETEDPTANLNITTLIVDMRNYMIEIDEAYDSFILLPERKDADWFHEHYGNSLIEATEANEWIKKNVEENKILVFGLNVENIMVASLVFSEGLIPPSEFEDKIGIFLHNDLFSRPGPIPKPPECPYTWCSSGYQDRGPNCSCWSRKCCEAENTCDLLCLRPYESIDLLDILFPDDWGLDFEALYEIPVHTINIGDPVLQF